MGAQHGWNGKLLWGIGAAPPVSRFRPPSAATRFNANALRRGFMVAASSLTDHGTNSNDTLAAETLMMVKEQIIENYGEIRYTIGDGCSGGSIMQYNIAAAYPGLLDGIQPNCTFPDTITTAIEITDCGCSGRYYRTAPGRRSPPRSAARSTVSNAGFCPAWVGSFLPLRNPSGGATAAAASRLIYDPMLRANGVRCTSFDHARRDARHLRRHRRQHQGQAPLDNVGVQYGLKALRRARSPPRSSCS